MKYLISFVTFVGLFICSQRLHAQFKDSILLYNGQVLIGDIKTISLGVVTIDDKDLKTVDIKSYKIKVMKSVQEFKIETDDKITYYGRLEQASQDGWTKIIFTGSDSSIEIPIVSINMLLTQHKGFIRSLQGSFTTGFSFTKSSLIGQFNLGATVYYPMKNMNFELSASSLASIDSGTYSRDQENLELFATHNIGATWFAAASIDYQRNLELSIARRYQEMVGAGNKLILKKNIQLLAISGITFNQELSTAGEESKLLLELPIIFRFNFFQYRHPNIQISSSPSAYIGLTDRGRFRFNGNTAFSWEIIRDFSVTLSFTNSYDNKPPAGGHNFDYGLVWGISYKF